MYPLVFENLFNSDSFELLKIKNSIESCLDLQNVNYTTSFFDETFDLVHFFSVNDFSHYSKEIKKSVKKVISLLSCEEDPNLRIIKGKKENNDNELIYFLEKKDVEIINRADAILVPSLKAKEFLLSNGVTTKIFTFFNPVRSIKYDLKNNVLNKAIFRYLGINEDSYIVVSSLSYEDYLSLTYINNLALSFPMLKFVLLTTKDINKNFYIKAKKIFDEKITNIRFTNIIDDDIYASLFYNAKVFINLSSTYGNDQELIDAMVSKTQILTLNSSSFSDIAIDKENCYTYNNFADLKKGLNQYFNGLLPSTIDGGIKFSKDINFKEQSEELLKIYKEVLEEN